MSFYYSCGPGGSRVLLTDGNKPVAADGCSLRSELGSGSAQWHSGFAAMLFIWLQLLLFIDRTVTTVQDKKQMLQRCSWRTEAVFKK